MQDCLATSLKVETWGYKTCKFHFHGKPHHRNTSALNNGRDMIHLPALLDNLVGLWSQLYMFCSCQAVAIWRIHRHADGCATNAPGPFPHVAVARPGTRVPPIIIHFVRVQASRSASQHTEVHWQSAVWWIAGARQDLLSGHLSLKMPFFFPQRTAKIAVDLRPRDGGRNPKSVAPASLPHHGTETKCQINCGLWLA